MRDLVSHDHGDAGFVMSHRHDAFPERDFSAGKAKRVDFFTLQNIELPLVVGFRRSGGNPCANSLQLRLPRLIFGKRSFLENIFVRIISQLLFVALGHEVHLGTTGILDRLAAESEQESAQQKDVPMRPFDYLSHWFFLPSEEIAHGAICSVSWP